MAAVCAAPPADGPLVRGLLTATDCHVRELVHTGYGALFPPTGGLSAVLTALLTIYVALIGYQLMLGRAQLRIADVTLSVVKLGGVLVFATQWETYQALVFQVLFDGPAQIATAMLHGVGADAQGDVFDGLQRAFDTLSTASAAYAGKSPVQASPFLGGAGFAAFALNSAAGILLLSSLGVVLAAKIVLGVLLATGPIFLALLLFETTRGLFEGWMRASLAFAFAPLGITFLLAVILAILEPSLAQIVEIAGAKDKGAVSLGPVYGVFTLVLVFAGVATGLLVAAGVIFGGFRLPRAVRPPQGAGRGAAPGTVVVAAAPSRAGRVAHAVAVQARREGAQAGPAGSANFTSLVVRSGGRTANPKPRTAPSFETRGLGQTARRSAGPRAQARPDFRRST